MWQTIIEAISKFFGFSEQLAENKGAKIPMQEVAIREDANTDALKELRKQDRIKDRWLRKTPKIVYHYDDLEAYGTSLLMEDNERPLYYGNKDDILFEIKKDLAKILTTREQRVFRRIVQDSDKPYFIIKIHPLTVQEN